MPQLNIRSTSGRANRNAGIANVVFNLNKMANVMLIPKGEVIPASAFADLKTYIQGKLFADNYAERWQLFPKAVGVESAGEAAKTETSGFGDTRTVQGAKIAWSPTFWAGGKNFHTSARAFNGMADAFDLLYFDEKGVLCGTLVEGSNSTADGLKGYALADIFTDTAMQPDGSKGSETKTRFALADESEFNDHFAFLETSITVSQLKSVVDVDLSLVSNDGAGILVIAPKAGAENLVARFPTALNGLTAWVAQRMDTGATVAISAVTAVPGLGFRVTHTITGIPAATQIQTRLASVTILKGLGVEGFESDAIEWVTP